MRSPNFYAVACRAPNEEIIVKTEPLEETWIGRQKWLEASVFAGDVGVAGHDGVGDAGDELGFGSAFGSAVSARRGGP